MIYRVGLLHFWMVLLFFPWSVEAVPKVVVSIKPLHSLVSGVMEGVGEPNLLLKGNASVHAYSMRPSEVSMLQQAELFFWVGPQLETFLEKPLASLTNSMISVELIETKGLQIHRYEKKSFWISGGDERNFIDPHLWLDPWNAIRMVQRISQELTEVDPENARRYQENSKFLQQKLKRLDQHLEQDLGALKQKPFAVFHPAYTYLEKRFDLMRVGVVNIHPERPPGARHLAKLRRMMQQNGIECLFREPQFEPRLTDMLLQGTKVRSAVLDPLGAELDAGPELYFTLLRNLGKSFRQCLDS